MANVIQIKHGTGNPDGRLAPYELGYREFGESGCLYIGGEQRDGEYGDAIPLNVFGAQCLLDSDLKEITNCGDTAKPIYINEYGHPAECEEVLSTNGGTIEGSLSITGSLTVGGDGSQGPSSGIKISSAEITGNLTVNGIATLNKALVGAQDFLWGDKLPDASKFTKGSIFFKIN